MTMSDLLIKVPDTDVNIQDQKARSPTLLAVVKMQLSLVEALLGANADPNLADTARSTPLHAAFDLMGECLE